MSRLSNTLTRLSRLLGIRPRALEEDRENTTEQEQANTTEELEDWHTSSQIAWQQELELVRRRQRERYNRYYPDTPHYFLDNDSNVVHVSHTREPIQWSTPTNRSTNIYIDAANVSASSISAIRVHAGLYQQHTNQVQSIARKEKPPIDPRLPPL